MFNVNSEIYLTLNSNRQEIIEFIETLNTSIASLQEATLSRIRLIYKTIRELKDDVENRVINSSKIDTLRENKRLSDKIINKCIVLCKRLREVITRLGYRETDLNNQIEIVNNIKEEYINLRTYFNSF
jgi:hypothetical protein